MRLAQYKTIMEKKNKYMEVVTHETPPVITPQLVPQNQSAEVLIAKAIENNTPVETMERLLNMRRELKAEYAKGEFDKAMALFQGECPVIKKTRAGGTTSSGQVAYHYAPLESIVVQTKDLIQKHGFSYAIQTETKENMVKVTCRVKHSAGHSESSDVEVPLGTRTGVMSASQVVASALTFAKRYAFCNAFGILTGDDDDDSKSTVEAERKDTAFEKLMSLIGTSDLKTLGAYRSKMKESDKYTPHQKVEFLEAVDKRIAELEKGVIE